MASDLASVTLEIRNLCIDAAAALDADSITAGVRQCLRELNAVIAYDRVATITLAAAGREISIASLTPPATVVAVWLPYTAAAPEFPPNRRLFEQWGGSLSVVYILDGEEPVIGQVARCFYHTPHALKDLDSATTTTLDDLQIGALVYGATASALSSRRRQIAESVKADPKSIGTIEGLRDECRRLFYEYLNRARKIPGIGSGGDTFPGGWAMDEWDGTPG